jgi:serine O-acetyltransferase
MQTSLKPARLADYLAAQLSAFFPDGVVIGEELRDPVSSALQRVEKNFSAQHRKYFYHDAAAEAVFDHLHTDQYAVFLYYVANGIHRAGGDRTLAAKVFALNKALHAVDIFYEFDLPQVFALQHPVGTVLGRAEYGNYLFVYQQCLVGVGLDGSAPKIGDGVILFGGSSVIGASRLGSNVWVSAGTLIIDAEIPANSVVSGRSPDLTIKPTQRDVLRDVFQGTRE